jgi:hypothetical protein
MAFQAFTTRQTVYSFNPQPSSQEKSAGHDSDLFNVVRCKAQRRHSKPPVHGTHQTRSLQAMPLLKGGFEASANSLSLAGPGKGTAAYAVLHIFSISAQCRRAHTRQQPQQPNHPCCSQTNHH